jgi:hypothetical protein
MDLEETIREVRREREALDRVIAFLESLAERASVPGKSQHGRKTMLPAERQRVSERMKQYWAKRRAKARRPAD